MTVTIDLDETKTAIQEWCAEAMEKHGGVLLPTAKFCFEDGVEKSQVFPSYGDITGDPQKDKEGILRVLFIICQTTHPVVAALIHEAYMYSPAEGQKVPANGNFTTEEEYREFKENADRREQVIVSLETTDERLFGMGRMERDAEGHPRITGWAWHDALRGDTHFETRFSGFLCLKDTTIPTPMDGNIH